MNPQNQPTGSPVYDIVARRHARFKIEADVRVYSRTCGLLTGHTVDLSEAGASAMLRLELPLGEVVELNLTLPLGLVVIHAVVRQRSAFRYGFQFLESDLGNEIIQSTCRMLAAKQPSDRQ